jgi:hypothetical protein
MYDMGAANRFGLRRAVILEQRREMLARAVAERDIEFAGGQTEFIGGIPEQLSPQPTAVDREFYDFYRTARGQRSNTAPTPPPTRRSPATYDS